MYGWVLLFQSSDRLPDRDSEQLGERRQSDVTVLTLHLQRTEPLLLHCGQQTRQGLAMVAPQPQLVLRPAITTNF